MAVTLDGDNGISTPQILNAGANGSGNIGSANSYFGTLFVTTLNIGNNIGISGNLNIGGTSTLAGVVTAPTASAATNNTQVATTAYVTTKVNTATASLGTMSTQNSNSVNISGGSLSGVSITNITDLAVADGGTGRSSLTSSAVLIGNGTGAVNFVSPGTNGNILAVSGGTWTSTTPASILPGLGYGSTGWNNVTGSRSFNTQYTNSRAYPIAVSARTTCSGGSAIDMYVNGQRISNFSWQFNGCGSFGGGFIIVPPGATYQLNSGQGLDLWVELY